MNNGNNTGSKTTTRSARRQHDWRPARSALATQIRLGLFGLLVASQSAFAAPQGGEIAAGQGSISAPDASTTLIQQQTNNLAINWQSFNVGAQETVRFEQPSASATVLNRILDQNPSQILGNIQANGRVFLMNPNGVLFGEGSRVEVAGLLASGLDMKVEDFMNGNYKLQTLAGQEGGVVVNRGLLQAATGGNITLVGGAVQNVGVIIADAGHINLAAGRTAVVDFDGDGLIKLQVDDKVLENSAGVDAAVSNSGTLQAEGGQVLMTANAARDVFSSVVNNSGTIKAGRIDNSGGVVRLVGTGGATINSGSIDAAGRDAASTGGTVEVTGDNVGLLGASSIDASGATGGGTVLVGGDLHGANAAVQNAEQAYVASTATIKADATDSGNGGKVVVWSDKQTRYYGNISARGGATGGNGGFVEVSGKQNMDFHGGVDTSAPKGAMGTLLLDPTDIIIADGTFDSAADGTGTFAGDPTGTVGSLFTADTTPTTIYESELEGLAAGTNIVLQASNNITIQDLTDNNLNLATTGSVTFTADSDASGAGAFSMDASDTITTAGASLTISGASVTVGGVTTNSGTLSLTASGAGNVSATGVVNSGTGDTYFSSGSGDITVDNAANVFGFMEVDTTGTATIVENSTTNFRGTSSIGSLNLTSTGAITNSGGASVLVTGAATLGGSSITMNTGSVTFGSIDATAGTVTISESDAMDIAGLSATTASMTANGAITDSGDIAVTGAATFNAGANSITLGDAGGETTNFGTLNATGSTIDISEDSAMDIGIVSGTAVTLTSSGAMTDAALDSNNNITATTSLSLTAGTSIGMGDAIETATPKLTLNVGTSFDVANSVDLTDLTIVSTQNGDANTYALTSTAALSFDIVDGGTRYDMNTVTDNTGLNFTFTGDEGIRIDNVNVGTSTASITSTAGLIQENSGGDAGADVTAGTIMLKAADSIGASVGGSGALETNTTNLTLDMGTDFNVANTGDLTDLTIISTQAGDNNTYALTSTGLSFSLSDNSTHYELNTVTDATGLNFTFQGDDNIWIDSVNVGAGTVDITSTTADIREKGTDAGADVTAGTINFNAATGIGAPGAIETAATTISAVTTTGDIQIAESDGATVSGSSDTGNITFTTDTGNLTVGNNITTTGTVDLTASGGDILRTGGTVSGSTVTLTAGGSDGDIGASGAAIQTAATTLAFAGAGAGDVYITEANGATVSGTTGSGAIAVTSTTGDLTVGNNITTTGTVDLTASGGDILRTGGTVSGSTVTLTAGGLDGDIGASGAAIQTAATTLAFAGAGTGDVYITEADGATVSGTTSSGSVAVTSTTGNLTVGGNITTSGTVALTATAGDILRTGGTVGGSTVTLAADGDIGTSGASLQTAASSISAASTNGDIDIANTLATAVTATSLTTGTGSITFAQSGGGALSVTTATTTDGAIDLSNTGAALTAGTVTAGGTGDVTLTTTTSGDVLIGSVTATGNTVTVSSAGAINDSVDDSAVPVTDITAAVIDLTAATSIGADNATPDDQKLEVDTADLTLNVGNSFNLDDAADLSDLTIVSTQSGDANTYILTSSTLTFDVVDAGTVYQFNNVIDNTGLNFSFQGDQDFLLGNGSGTGIIDASGTVTLTTTGLIRDTENDAATDITSGIVNLNAGQGIGAAPFGIEMIADTISAITTTGDINITESDGATVSGSTDTGNITFTVTSGDLTLGNNITTTGTVGLTTSNGDILRTAGTVSGSTVTLTAGGADGDIGASGAAIQTNATTLAFAGAGTGDVYITEANGASVSGTTGSGAIAVTSTTGNLTVGNNITTTGTVDLTASAGDILRTAGTVSGSTVTLTAGGADGDIGASGAAIQTAATNVAFAGAGTGDVYITEANGATVSGTTGSGAVALTSTTGDLTVGGNITTTGTVDLTATAGDILRTGGTVSGSTVTLTAGGLDGDIGASGAAIQTAATTLAFTGAGTGDVYITEADGATVSGTTGSGTIALTSTTGNLTLGGNITTTGTVDLTASAGDIVRSAGTVTGGTVALAADGNIGTSGASIQTAASNISADSTNGDVDIVNALGTAVTASSLTTGTGTITFAQSGGGALSVTTATTADGAIDLSNTGANLTVATVTAGGTNDVTLTTVTSGDVIVNGTVTATGDNVNVVSAHQVSFGTSTVNADLSVTATAAGGGVVQTGALTVNGASDFDAGANDITLTNAGNDFTGAVTLTGATTQVTDMNALTLGTLATGDLTVISTGDLDLGQGTVTGNLGATSNGGAITQSGALTVTGTSTIDAGANSITLTDAGNDFMGTVSLNNSGANDVAITDTNELDLIGSSIGGALAVNSGGALSQTGTLTAGTSGSGTIDITAASGDITQLGNISTSSGAITVTSSTGSINMAATAVTTSGAENIDYSAANGNVALGHLDAGTGVSGGTVTVIASTTTGLISDAGLILPSTTNPNITGSTVNLIAKNIGVSLVSPLWLQAQTAVNLTTDETAYIDGGYNLSGPGSIVNIIGTGSFFVPSTVFVDASKGQTVKVEDLGYIDPSLFQDLSLFGIIAPGIKLPEGQEEEQTGMLQPLEMKTRPYAWMVPEGSGKGHFDKVSYTWGPVQVPVTSY